MPGENGTPLSRIIQQLEETEMGRRIVEEVMRPDPFIDRNGWMEGIRDSLPIQTCYGWNRERADGSNPRVMETPYRVRIQPIKPTPEEVESERMAKERETCYYIAGGAIRVTDRRRW